MITPKLSVRIKPENPNHHLWNNNGTWFVHYTIFPDDYTKERIRRSLKTRSLKKAREQRDLLLARFPQADNARSPFTVT